MAQLSQELQGRRINGVSIGPRLKSAQAQTLSSKLKQAIIPAPQKEMIWAV